MSRMQQRSLCLSRLSQSIPLPSTTLFLTAVALLLLPTTTTSVPSILPVSAQISYVNQLTDQTSCIGPVDIFVYGNGLKYIACAGTGSVIQLDTVSNTYTSILNNTYCNFLQSVIRHPTTGVVYAGCSEGIFRIDGNVGTGPLDGMNSVVSLLMNRSTTNMAFNSDATSIVSASEGLGLARVDLNTAVVSSVVNRSVCRNVEDALVFQENGVEYIVAACIGDGTVKINVQSREFTVIATLDQCNTPSSIFRDSATGDIYLSCQTSGAVVVRGSNVTTIVSDDQCKGASDVQLDARSSLIVVACGIGNVLILSADVAAQTLVPYFLCPDSRKVAFDLGEIVVACTGGNAISVPTSTATVVASPLVCRNPRSLTIANFNGSEIVIGGCANGVVEVFRNDVIRTLANSSYCVGATSLFQNSSSNHIIAACGSNGVLSIDSTTQSNSMILGGPTSQCSYVLCTNRDPDTGVLYVGCLNQGVVRYDPMTATSTLLLPYSECNLPNQIARIAETNSIVAACGASGVKFLSPDGKIRTLANSTHKCYDATSFVVSNGTIYVACNGQNALIMIQLASGNITTLLTYAECPEAGSVTQSPLNGALIVSCMGRVLGIDIVTRAVSSILTSAQCPNPEFAIQDATTGAIYVACYLQGIMVSSVDFKCFPGTFWSATFGGSCTPCPLNTFRAAENLLPMGQCEPCPDGWVTTQTGSLACVPCAAGSYDFGKTCLLCPLGKAQSASGSTQCVDCPQGSYAVVPGLTTCPLCDPGFYASSNGSALCLPCDRGTASNAPGLTHACQGCPAGTYQVSVGKTSCIPCEPHTYAEQDNSTSCTHCPNQVSPDRTACNLIICDANSFFDDLTSSCQLCPLSQYSIRGGLCGTCQARSYTPSVGSGCASCDDIEGLDCNGGLASVKPGYFAFIDHGSDNGLTPYYALYQTVPCPPNYCPGSLLQLPDPNASASGSGSGSGSSGSPSFNNVTASLQLCLHPRLNDPNNLLCAQCEEGYLAWGDSCLTCDHANVGLAFAYLILSFALVLFLLLTSSSSSSTSSIAASMSIFLFFIQTAALEIGPLVHYIDWIQLANLDPKSTATCLAPWSAYGQTLFALFIPVILMAELMVVAIIHYCMHRVLRANESDSESVTVNAHGHANGHANGSANGGHKVNSASSIIVSRLRRFSFSEYRACMLSILLFCYTQVTTACLRYLHCIEVGTLASVNFSAPTMDCRSSEYKQYLVAVLFALIVYVIGFPLIALFVLWRNKGSLYQSSSSSASASSSPALSVTATTSSTFLIQWSPFYVMYHRRAWFWQCWVLLRRAALVVTAVMLMQQTAKRFMTFTFLHFASVLLHVHVKPYESVAMNHVETVSYALLIAISEFLGGYYGSGNGDGSSGSSGGTNGNPYPESVQALMFVLVVPPAIGMVGLIVVQRYQIWQRRGVKPALEDESKISEDHSAPAAAVSSSNGSSSTAVELSSVPVTVAVNESILPAYALESDQQQL